MGIVLVIMGIVLVFTGYNGNCTGFTGYNGNCTGFTDYNGNFTGFNGNCKGPCWSLMVAC